MRVQLVVNSPARNARSVETAHRLESELMGRGHEVRTLVVGELAEARRWAQGCAGGFDCLFCLGGDTTLEVLAPAAMRLSVPFVPVPVGFGNTFARALGHHQHRRAIPRLLGEGEVRWVDVGVGRDGIFLVSHGRGLLYQVEQVAGQRARHAASPLLRYLMYVEAALRVLRDMPLPRVRVAVDGDPLTDEAALVVSANVPTYHGFLNMTPSATPEDGLLDVVAVPRTTKLRLFSLLVAFCLHVPGRHPRVLYRRGKRVDLRSEGEAPEELEILPRALPVLAPRRAG